MLISVNYRFLLRMAISMAVATSFVGLLLMKVLGHHKGMVPLWGRVSMATDLIAFSMAFGFLLSWAATLLTRQALRQRKIYPLHWHLKSQTLIDRLPTHILHRAFILGLAGVTLAAIMLMMLQLRHLTLLPYHEYLVLFVLHAISLTAIITVMAVYRALSDKVMKHAVLENKN